MPTPVVASDTPFGALVLTLDRLADLTDADRAAAAALGAIVYPPADHAHWPGRHLEWDTPEWCVRVHDGGAIVSFAGVYLRDATLDGTSVLVGGVGKVKTHPAARGRGFAAAAVRRAGEFFEAHGAAFGLLVCRAELVAYYERLGWREFAGRLIVRQRGEATDFTLNGAMALAVRADAPAAGTIDLCGPPW
ncbi:GNAT family N-acetyltransferase [bacterium]|nr:GNAT family N-acetyltransferase [bacterium]